MIELKPCPFCGNSVQFDKAYSYFRDSVIYCNDCDMIFTLDDCSASDDDICIAWNRRADDADPVKVGYLIEGRYPNDFKCSVCGQVFRDDIIWIYDIEEKGHQKFPPEYCPECGVKWKGCEFIDDKT